MLGRRDEVGEGVLLVEHLALIIPRAPHLLSATYVRDGVDEAAVEQAEVVGREGRIGAGAIRAVGVEQERPRAVLHQRLLVHERDRHHGAVRGARPRALGGVLGRVVAAEHFLLLAELTLLGRHVEVVHRGRRHQRRVREAQRLRIVLGIPPAVGGVHRLREVDDVGLLRREIHDADLAQRLGALVQHQIILEDVDVAHERRVAMGHQHRPVLLRRVALRRRHHLEVRGLPFVGQNDEAVAVVLRAVLEVLLPRMNHLPLVHRVHRVEVAHLGGGIAVDGHQEVLLVLRQEDGDVEEHVGLVEDHDVLRRIRAEHVADDLVVTLRGIGRGVEERLAVSRPRHGPVHVVDAIGEELPGVDVLHHEGEALAAGGVHREGVELLVGTHAGIAHAEVAQALGHRVLIEDDLLGRVEAPLLARHDGVLLPLDGARVVVVVADPFGNGEIGLLDARQELLVELLLERLGVLHRRIRVRVLGGEIRHDIGVAAVAQPEVVVHADVAVQRVHLGYDLGDGRLDLRGDGDGEQQRERQRAERATNDASAKHGENSSDDGRDAAQHDGGAGRLEGGARAEARRRRSPGHASSHCEIEFHYGASARVSASRLRRSISSSTGTTSCLRPAPRTRSATVPCSASRFPTTAMYGTFITSPSRMR